ncbi:hypothetical protein HOG16_00620 [Candidatus Woesearchaeota archaeon]|nr:hypothetical protein [Candidatus Woesearchaeota archaeon]
MNFRILFLVFFVILFCNFSFAAPLSLEFEKDSYFSGETVQGKIFFDESFNDVIRSNDFYMGFNESTFNIYPVLIEFENYTYFYFDLPVDLENGSYDFVIENVLYVNNNVLVEEDQFFNLDIISLEGPVFTISPALINIDLETDNWFEIELNNPSEETAFVNISFLDDFIFTNYDYFSLNSGYSKTVRFYVSSYFANKSESFIYMDYSNLSYSIPAFIEGLVIREEENVSEPINITNETQILGGLVFIQRGFDADLKLGESDSGFVKIFNDFNQDLNDINFELTGNLAEILDLEFTNVEILKAGKEVINHFYVNENKNGESGVYEGNLEVKYNDEVYDSISIMINILSEDEVPINDSLPEINISDERKEPDEPSSNKPLLFGILAFVVVLAILILIKYKKSKKKSNLPFEKN